MSTQFDQLIMISAMYENGGNTFHRMLDGHSNLWVYPFESQPGSKFVNDMYASMYPLKYRWPVIPSHFSAGDIYETIIDEECKVRTKTPLVSKFRDWTFELNDQERKAIFIKKLGDKTDRKSVMFAYFEASFDAWKNKYSTSQKIAVGYSPIIGIDGDAILKDLGENGKMIHVVRNPFSAFAETKSRAVPMSLANYLTGWISVQQVALYLSKKHPSKFKIVRYEDAIGNTSSTLNDVFDFIGAGAPEDINFEPTWNGESLDKLTPWGIVNHKTLASNIDKAKELSTEEIQDIYLRAELFVKEFNYQDLYSSLL